jgi:hypothetical protein
MQITLRDGLPFVTASISFQGRMLLLDDVLLDTGSLGTVFSVDKLMAIGLEYEEADRVYRIRGVGGAEFVFSKQLEKVWVGDLEATDFEIEVGAMDYGFEINGIIGMDFLTKVGAVIDVAKLEVYRSQAL